MITIQNRNESFLKIRRELGTKQQLVLDTIKAEFPDGVSARQLAEHLYLDGKVSSPDRNQVHPRLNELVAAGLIVVTGKIKDSVTQRSVAWYRLEDWSYA